MLLSHLSLKKCGNLGIVVVLMNLLEIAHAKKEQQS